MRNLGAAPKRRLGRRTLFSSLPQWSSEPLLLRASLASCCKSGSSQACPNGRFCASDSSTRPFRLPPVPLLCHALGAGSRRNRQILRQQVREDPAAICCECDLGSLVCLPKRNKFLAHDRLE